MIDDTEAARDAVSGKFWTAWQANAPAVNDGVVPPVEWPNIDKTDPGYTDLSMGKEPWARFYMRHTSGQQSGLGAKQQGSRVFSHNGIVIVQIFTLAGTRGLLAGDRLGKVVVEAFEGEEAGDVWFRNVVLREIGVAEPWFQVNVSAEFVYYNRK